MDLSYSIIVPTYNRPERLQKCLESITLLDFPQEKFEVIVVDDGSENLLDPVVALFTEQLSLSLIRQQNAGPASARNAGAFAAKGDYLAFTDDDCQPEPDWLTTLSEAIAEAPDALIGGYTVNALPDNPYSSASQILIDYLYSYYNQSQKKSSFFASNNFAVPRQLFLELGGFDTSFPLAAGEDREFCDRWQFYHHSTHYASNMIVRHAHKLSPTSFWKQHFNYGCGAFCFHEIRAKHRENKIEVEPLHFYLNLLIYPFQKFNLPKSVVLSMLLLLSQVANVLGFAWVKSQRT